MNKIKNQADNRNVNNSFVFCELNLFLITHYFSILEIFKRNITIP